MTKTVPIHTEFVKLEQLLKLAGCAPTGGAAKQAIKSGEVRVNGDICLERGRKLRPGDRAAYQGDEYEVVRLEN